MVISLVQYKSDGCRPMIVFLGKAVDQAYNLFQQLGQGIEIDNEPYNLAIHNLKADEIYCSITR